MNLDDLVVSRASIRAKSARDGILPAFIRAALDSTAEYVNLLSAAHRGRLTSDEHTHTPHTESVPEEQKHELTLIATI